MEGRRAENGLDRTVTARSDNPDVFDDEYEVETPTSADFHPGDGILTGASGGPDRSSRNLSIPRNNSLDAKATSLPSRNSIRNSIRKSRSAFEGAGAVNDRSTTPVSGTNAQLGDLPQRSSSRASSTFATTERASSPQQQAGPSFPYSLYQQTSAGMGRSPSLATTNAARTSIASSVPQIPAHPYGLYSQNGLDEGGEVSSAQQSIPLGFPGRGDGFHRQVGPDGEEQDIVGPDGHTEQLPPYSRYPEEGAAKVAAVPTVSQPVSPRSVESSTPPQLPSANASRALILDPGSSEASEEISEKSWKEKTWTERRRARVCGGRLPCWMLVFIVVSSIIIAGLVAGLVGGLLSAERKNHHSKSSHTVTTTLFDASLIPAPTGLPGASPGGWALPLGIPEEQQNGCITDSSQTNAWTCAQYGPPLLLNVTGPPPGPPQRVVGSAQLGDISPNDNKYNYGTQPPKMEVSTLEWVIDLDDPRQGPALHFQAMYDKQVLVSEDDFGGDANNPSRLFRRGGGNDPRPGGNPFKNNKGRVDNGDQPWLCYWNQTFIEGFIYIKQNSSDAASQSSAFASFTSKTPVQTAPLVKSSTSAGPVSNVAATSPAATTSSPPASASGGFTAPSDMPSSEWPSYFSSLAAASAAVKGNFADASASAGDYNYNHKRDGSAILASDTGPTSPTSSSFSAVSDEQSTSSSSSPPPPPASTATVTTTAPPSVYTVVATGSGTISPTSFTVPTMLPLFPHIVKVEERRMSMQSNKAQCIKLQFAGDELVPLPGPDNGQIVVTLSESDPSDSEFEGDKDKDGDKDGDGMRRRRRLKKRRYRRMWDHKEVSYTVDLDIRDNEPVDSCHCQWRNS